MLEIKYPDAKPKRDKTAEFPISINSDKLCFLAYTEINGDIRQMPDFIELYIEWGKIMRIIEHFIKGKENNLETCEDGIFTGSFIAAVIDGVTPKSSRLWQGKTSGRYARDILLDFLRELSGSELQFLTPEEFFSLLDRQLAIASSIPPEKTAAKDPDAAPLQITDYPRASTILYNDICHEIWAYGDCQCAVNGQVYTHEKEIDRLNAGLRAFHLEYELQKGKTLEDLVHASPDPGRTAIQENLKIQMSFENKNVPFGYPVLNGQGIEPSMIKVYPVKPGDQILLASDGYPVLRGTLEESEKELQRILTEDPLCFRSCRSTKGKKSCNISFDDRAYCRILVQT